MIVNNLELQPRNALSLGVGPVGLDPRQGLLLSETGTRFVEGYLQQALHVSPLGLEAGTRVQVDRGGSEDEIILIIGEYRVPVPRTSPHALLFLARV